MRSSKRIRSRRNKRSLKKRVYKKRITKKGYNKKFTGGFLKSNNEKHRDLLISNIGEPNKSKYVLEYFEFPNKDYYENKRMEQYFILSKLENPETKEDFINKRLIEQNDSMSFNEENINEINTIKFIQKKEINNSIDRKEFQMIDLASTLLTMKRSNYEFTSFVKFLTEYQYLKILYNVFGKRGKEVAFSEPEIEEAE